MVVRRLRAVVVAGLLVAAVFPLTPATADKGVGKNGLITLQVPKRTPITSTGCASVEVKIRVPKVEVDSYWGVELASRAHAQRSWHDQGWDFNRGTGRASTSRRNISICGIPSLSPYGRYRIRAVFKVGDDVTTMARRDLAFATSKVLRS